MPERNPYEVPGAALEERSSSRSAALIYAGFWRRVGAFFVDFIVLLPLFGVVYAGMQWSRLFSVAWFVPGLLIGLWFNVYLVWRYGGSPGKLLLKMKVAMVDGTRVTLSAATIRYAVLFVLSAAVDIALLLPTLQMTDETYFSLSYMQRAETLTRLAPSWYGKANIALQVWMWSEFLTMLFNRRRRSVQDFMAGTVVLRTAPSARN